MDDDLVLVEAGRVRDGLPRVLGGTRQLESLGPAEGGRGPDLARLVGVHLYCVETDQVSSVRSNIFGDGENKNLRP